MQAQTKLSDIDVDGAIQEAAHEAIEGLEPGDTRLDFFKKAGLTGGAVMGGGVLLSALTPRIRISCRKGRPPASYRQGRHRHPQLRPHPRVPGVGVL